MSSRRYIVKHLELDGAMNDRHPQIKFELHPIGIITTHPTDRLRVAIGNNDTLLDSKEAAELRDWLTENLRAQTCDPRT